MSRKFTSLTTANVNCMGGRHVVAVASRPGKMEANGIRQEQTVLIALNHLPDSEYSLSRIRAIKVLAPEFRCRCSEVFSAWKVYTSYSDNQIGYVFNQSTAWKEIPEASDCMISLPRKREEQILKITRSDILSLIPKSLRREAQKAREKSRIRQRRKRHPDFIVDNNGFGPKFTESFLMKGFGTGFDYRSKKSVLEKKAKLGADFHKKFYRLLWREASKCGFRREFKWKHGDSIASRIQGRRTLSPICSELRETSKIAQWVHYYHTSPWMRELLNKGHFPIQIPPRMFWELHNGERLFPSYVLAGRWSRAWRDSGVEFETTYVGLSLKRWGPGPTKTLTPNSYLSPQEKKELDDFFILSDFNHILNEKETP